MDYLSLTDGVIDEQVWSKNFMQIFQDLMVDCNNFESSEYKTRYIRFLHCSDKCSSSCDTEHIEEMDDALITNSENIEKTDNDGVIEQIFLETTV